MSDQANGYCRNQAEEDLAEIRKNLRELTALSLHNEFNSAAYRQANDERWQKSEEHFATMEALQRSTQKHLDYLTQLASIFADRTVKLEAKAQRVRDAL